MAYSHKGKFEVDGEITLGTTVITQEGSGLGKMTMFERLASTPDDGTLVYDTDLKMVFAFLDGTWREVITSNGIVDNGTIS